MNKYLVGLQLHSDIPEYEIEIIAKNSDEAWDQAQEYYRSEQFSKADLTTMALWNEKKITLN